MNSATTPSHETDRSVHEPLSAATRSSHDPILRQTPPSTKTGLRTPGMVPKSESKRIFYTPYETPSPFPRSLVLDPSSSSRRPTPKQAFMTPALQNNQIIPPPASLLLSEKKHDAADAASFARSAPISGYLTKLSAKRDQFKNYFFVLKPSTHLYYFQSPNDTEPRGCIDLEEAPTSLKKAESFPDGRTRFVIQLSSKDSKKSISNRSVVLEARSDQLCEQWLEAMKTERISHYQEEIQLAQRRATGHKQRIKDLEHLVENYRMVEKDRDGAIEDAAQWKSKYDKLNEAVRLMTLKLRREAVHNEECSESKDGEIKNEIKPYDDDETATSHETEDMVNNFEELVHEVSGSSLPALYNACEQLKDHVRLASEEASSAVQDLTVTSTSLDACKEKLRKAEKHMCKLWEDTTSLRNELKITKQEKRILVREVKILRAKESIMPKDLPADCEIGDAEAERLVEELEEQVESSIRIHEEFLAKNRSMVDPPNLLEEVETVSLNSSKQSSLIDSEKVGVENADNNKSPATMKDASAIDPSYRSGASSPVEPKTLSLLDIDSDDDNSSVDEEEIGSAISSVGADLGEGSTHGTPLREDLENDHSDIKRQIWSRLDMESESREGSTTSISLTARSVVTENGQATSQLACPLADVVETSNAKNEEGKKEDTTIYHLTFYSRKIGLQFQKVPPALVNGVLTEAMTTDLVEASSDGSQTASELRRIADMTRRAKGFDISENENECRTAKPLDTVLVCGFHGFDDESNHTRPRLGARLVAFDGISVELGKWTFESIRKAIQARGRPLTLSFRNDFLTTEQRKVLTRAIEEVDSALPPLKRTIQYKTANTPTSVSSTQSGRSRRSSSEHIDTDGLGPLNARASNDDDSLSSSNLHHFSANTSIATHNDPRSFSSAGSSVFSASLVGPLISNLMQRLPPAQESDSKPDYLSRTGESLEKLTGHHDFQNSLL